MRGRLLIERIAGKDYTTLRNIEQMRELCRVEAKVPDFNSRPNGMTSTAPSPIELLGSSVTTAGMSARDAVGKKLERLNKS